MHRDVRGRQIKSQIKAAGKPPIVRGLDESQGMGTSTAKNGIPSPTVTLKRDDIGGSILLWFRRLFFNIRQVFLMGDYGWHINGRVELASL